MKRARNGFTERLVARRYARLRKRLGMLIAIGLHELTDPPGMTRWHIVERSAAGWDVQFECNFGGYKRILTQSIDLSTLERRNLRHMAQLEVGLVMQHISPADYLPHPPLSFYEGPKLNP